LLLASLGRVAGISGIVGNVLTPEKTRQSWQLGFLLGLVAIGWILLSKESSNSAGASPFVLVTAGLLVGIGTRLGSGCTSGHGVCGLSRFSRRSLVATCIFMGAAITVVAISRHVLTAGVQ